MNVLVRPSPLAPYTLLIGEQSRARDYVELGLLSSGVRHDEDIHGIRADTLWVDEEGIRRCLTTDEGMADPPPTLREES